MSLAGSYQAALPTIKSWNSSKDLDQLAAHFAANTQGAAPETGTGAYWQRAAGIKTVDSKNDFRQIYDMMKAYKAPSASASGAPTGTGGSPAAQATTATKDRAEAAYRESLPATTHRQNPWTPLKFGGGSQDEEHNFAARGSNANLATQGMLDAARAAQESTTRSADRFDAIALNSSQWMADIDSRNQKALSSNLSLPKNPTEALQGFYSDISDKMKSYLA